ncbi:unnamed protein product [Ophioblennius macclurei]
MGCRCCRMIKSYIYDPTVGVDVRKSDSAGSSLYQPHHLSGGVPSGDPLSDPRKQKQGFHNLGYSKSNDSTLKLEADNNHVNYKLHAAPSPGKGGAPLPAGEAGLYIIQPDAVGPRWVMQEKVTSQVPVYPKLQDYETQRSAERDPHEVRNGWDGSVTRCEITSKSLSTEEIDEGVGGTPEYPCDTGDEGSVLSVDIHTSTTSLSSVDTKDDPPKTPDVSTLESGISVAKSEDEDEARREADEVESVTESMVAEALAALEAATAGEECE